jgi:hypothetical protein
MLLRRLSANPSLARAAECLHLPLPSAVTVWPPPPHATRTGVGHHCRRHFVRGSSGGMYGRSRRRSSSSSSSSSAARDRRHASAATPEAPARSPTMQHGRRRQRRQVETAPGALHVNDTFEGDEDGAHNDESHFRPSEGTASKQAVTTSATAAANAEGPGDSFQFGEHAEMELASADADAFLVTPPERMGVRKPFRFAESGGAVSAEEATVAAAAATATSGALPLSGQQRASAPRIRNHGLTDIFRKMAPYIALHRGKTIVIHVPGEVIDKDYTHFESLVQDIILLKTLGCRIVLVTGCRPQINERLYKAGRNPLPMMNGIDRRTDAFTLRCVREASSYARVYHLAAGRRLPNGHTGVGARLRTRRPGRV